MTHGNPARIIALLTTLVHLALCSTLLAAYEHASAKPAACASDSKLFQNIVTGHDVDNVIAFRLDKGKSRVDTRPNSYDDTIRGSLSNDVRFDIGVNYLTGTGSIRDPQRALLWFLSAAEHDDIEAKMIVAYLYANGIGAPADCQQAKEWLCRAGDSGVEEIKFAMGTRCSAASEHVAPLSSFTH